MRIVFNKNIDFVTNYKSIRLSSNRGDGILVHWELSVY